MRFAIVLFTASLLGCSKPVDPGEWKPTGDGKTVVHSITGEIKYTRTGLTVEETRRREIEAYEAHQAVEKEAEAKRKLESAAYAAREQREQEARDARAILRLAHNRALQQRVRAFVDANPTLPTFELAYQWDARTAAFRKGVLLTNDEVGELADKLGIVARHEQFKDDPLLKDAIAALHAWQH